MEIDLSCNDKGIFVKDNITLGQWHHILVRKHDDSYDVFVDGVLCVSNRTHKPQVSGYSTGVCFLSAPNNNNYIPCVLSGILAYNKALSDIKVKSHTNYNSVYRIRGTVTLMGNPTNAIVRVYSHDTGKLLIEVESDPLTGVYVADLLSNERLDVFVFRKQDENVKFRSYGYIVPHEMDDKTYSI